MMEQSEKNFKVENEEVLTEKKCGQFIHANFGHLFWTLRLASPLSHDKMQVMYSINSCTTWRIENESDFSMLKFIETATHYLDSLKCTFEAQHLCQQIESSIHNGKCLVVTAVDSNDLDKYDRNQIIFRQDSHDIEELEKRAKRARRRLQIMAKLEETNWKKTPAKPSKPEKKKKK